MKIFISQPMAGKRYEEIESVNNKILNMLEGLDDVKIIDTLVDEYPESRKL